jgi:hypothetical protein
MKHDVVCVLDRKVQKCTKCVRESQGCYWGGWSYDGTKQRGKRGREVGKEKEEGPSSPKRACFILSEYSYARLTTQTERRVVAVAPRGVRPVTRRVTAPRDTSSASTRSTLLSGLRREYVEVTERVAALSRTAEWMKGEIARLEEEDSELEE